MDTPNSGGTAPHREPVPLRACASILTAAILWGILGVWNRALMARGLTPPAIVAVRNSGGMLLLCALAAFRSRFGSTGGASAPSPFHVQRRHLKYFFGTGIVSVVLFTVCYFSCQKICSLSVASVLLYTAPSFVVLLSALLWKEPVTRRKAAALVLTLLGCAMVCGLFHGSDGGAVSVSGVLLGLGAGFFYALYSVFGRYALLHYPPETVTLWTFLFAGSASLLLLRPEHFAALCQPEAFLPALGLAAVSTAAPYALYTAGLSQMEAGKASILASLEPVAASLTGALVFQEPVSALGALGIGCVLSGVWILR